jgi:outer membrane protein TolC
VPLPRTPPLSPAPAGGRRTGRWGWAILLAWCWAAFGAPLFGQFSESSGEPLTLDRALALAASSNETPGIAAARLERAEAVRREAYSTLFPALTLSSTYTRRAREVTRLVNDEELVIQARNALNSQAVLDATLFDARAIPGVRAAGENLEAQRLESAELRRALTFDVAEAFYAVLSAERLRDAAARRAEVATATVEEASIRREAGLAAINDVTRSELELATARLLLTQSQSGIRSSRLALGYLMGLPVGEQLTMPLVEPAATGRTPAPAAVIETMAVENRADLRALRARAEALRLRAQEPQLRAIPALGLRGIYRDTNEAGLSGSERDWNLAATLTWELFDGGERYAQAAQRRAEHREALLLASALERRIGLEVRLALADLETAEGALAQADVRARVAAQNAEEIRERFGQGLASALERADAAAASFEAEAEVERQRFALSLAELALERAAGQGPRGASEAGTATGEEP